jgi:hypothetical protein
VQVLVLALPLVLAGLGKAPQVGRLTPDWKQTTSKRMFVEKTKKKQEQ